MRRWLLWTVGILILCAWWSHRQMGDFFANRPGAAGTGPKWP